MPFLGWKSRTLHKYFLSFLGLRLGDRLWSLSIARQYELSRGLLTESHERNGRLVRALAGLPSHDVAQVAETQPLGRSHVAGEEDARWMG